MLYWLSQAPRTAIAADAIQAICDNEDSEASGRVETYFTLQVEGEAQVQCSELEKMLLDIQASFRQHNA